MTVWFSKTRRGDTENVIFLRENGKDAEQDTLTFKAEVVALSSDQDYYYLSTFSASSVKGYKIMNDKKVDEPTAWLGHPVVVAIQRAALVTNTYKERVTEIAQTASHKYVSEMLAGFSEDCYYKISSMNLTNNPDVHSSIADLGNTPEDSPTRSIYQRMFLSMAYLGDGDLPLPAELEKLKALAAASAAPKPAFAGKGNYAPKETHADVLAACKGFIQAESRLEDGTLMALFVARGYTADEAFAEILLLVRAK